MSNSILDLILLW